MIKQEFEYELCTKIIPFWKNLQDVEQGGYYGFVGFDLAVDRNATKGSILNSRILWFFSNAYSLLKEQSLLEHATHAYTFLTQHCIDLIHGGVYWSLNADGTVKDDTKHTYNIAFAIYALSSYYDASKDSKALELALNLFNLVENKCVDEIGYLEAFKIDFTFKKNDKLSENGVIADKTMNTLLHILEAYTELYRVSKNPAVADKLTSILNCVESKVFNTDKNRLEIFFDKNLNSLLDLHSYGHDIEAAWLCDRACEVLNNQKLTAKIQSMTNKLEANILQLAYNTASVVNECEKGVVDDTRVWWVQSEAVVGFTNGYQKQPKKTEYLKAAENIWSYIKTFLIDSREGGEWYWEVDKKGIPDSKKPIVEEWKCPYHNGRMCIEMIRRLGNE